MDNSKLIEDFEGTWKYLRKMTSSFIECVPDEKWSFSHHPNFAPLYKQFCHMVKVYGCYLAAFESRKLDLSLKKSFYSGHGEREDILKNLSFLDSKLSSALAKLKAEDLNKFSVDVFGMDMSFSEYTYVMIQHEVSHFGIWANYAAFGEFQTPKLWQSDWKL